VLTDYGQSISRVLHRWMTPPIGSACGKRRVIAIYLTGARRKPSSWWYPYLRCDVLCCVVDITSYQLECLSTAGSRSSDISESIVTALAGLQTLTSTFLHLLREVLKVRALGLQTVQTALELRL
jgi:hypothetical protein